MRRRGYIWVEVLVIVAVGGVLGWLRSLFSSEDERLRQCQSHLKQIAIGTMQYVQDYDEKYPPAANRHSGWVELLQPYMKTTTLFQCPSEKHDAGSNPKQAGYTDYWFNRNVSSRHMMDLEEPAATLLSGDGDGGHASSNSRYAINSLPRAWLSTPGSPARRHRTNNTEDIGNYAFADGHVKVLRPQSITTAKLGVMNSGLTFSVD